MVTNLPSIFRGADRKRLAELAARFAQRAPVWGLPGRFQEAEEMFLGKHIGPLASSPLHDFYAIGLLQSGFAEELHRKMESGRPFDVTLGTLPLRVRPLHAGFVPVAKRPGARYAVGHFDGGRSGIFLLGSKEAPFPTARYFVFLPGPEHAENFALASAHLRSNLVNNNLPHAVGFVEALEKGRHVVLKTVQANFSARLVEEESDLPRKKEILPERIQQYYSHWPRILLRHVLEHYLAKGKRVLYPTPEQYAETWRMPLERAQRSTRDIEKVLEEMGRRARPLTPREEARYGLEGGVGFRVVE
jgi:hypothetical protein